jgi:FkbM family methyltransferase
MPSTGGGKSSRSVLISHELAMMAAAAKYNLDDRSHRSHSNKSLVRLFFDLIKIVGVDLFVEAGAKDAAASRRMKAKFPAARVVAFEANPHTYADFEAVNRDTGIEYLQLALSDHLGPVTFNVHRDEAGAPIANGQASLLKREKIHEDIERGFIEATVDAVTLDAFFADHDFTKAAVWIDVEGACKFVLPGARELLSKTAVLIIEVEEQPFWGEGHWLRDQVVTYLFDLGFIPVARDFEYRYQYNIVFVRAELLAEPNLIYEALARFVSRAYPPPPGKKAPPAAPPTFTWKRKARGMIRLAGRAARNFLALVDPARPRDTGPSPRP